jgi:hypothetical protein
VRVTAPSALQAKILYLQADNKVAENKSIYHLAFAAMLIMKRIFSEVYLCYLLPGCIAQIYISPLTGGLCKFD